METHVCAGKLGKNKVGSCSACDATIQQNADEQLAELHADYDSKVAAFVENGVTRIDRLLAAHGTAYLYSTAHIDIDSMMESMFEPTGIDLFEVASAGVNGWEVIGLIPRTYSGSQTYISKNKVTATSWGGGSTTQRVSLSGNVVGAYLLMRLCITETTRALHEDAIRGTLKKCVIDRLGPRRD